LTLLFSLLINIILGASCIADLFEDVTRKHKGTYPNLRGNTRVILAHGGPDLVPQFEPALRQEALRSLQKKGIDVILNTRVSELGEGFARLSTRKVDPATDELLEEREESVLPIGLSVWCAGTSPVPFVSDLLSQLPPDARYSDGRVKVDHWMRAPMKDERLLGSVIVMGDAAAFDEMGDGNLLPATAQVAGQAGAYVARLLNRGFELESTPPLLPCVPEDQDPCSVFNDPQLTRWLQFRGFDFSPPFRFLNLGMLAYTGGGEALSQVQLGDVPILSVGGSVSYLLWRSVYLVKQVATRNRILVTFDWVKSRLFGRDITRL
jgi:NADH dehydrogenase FAD-containing subunit